MPTASMSRFGKAVAQRPELLGDVFRGETAPLVGAVFQAVPSEEACASPLLPSDVTIAGEPVKVKDVSEEALVVHTHVWLCPGQQASVRVGRARATAMTILSSRVVAVKADVMTYAVQLLSAASRPLTRAL